MKKNKLGLVVLFLGISGFLGGILFAAINYSEYLPNSSSLYQSQTNGWASPNSGSSKEIMTPEGCKKITSTMSGRLFIPTKSMAEWTTFKNSAIAGITIAECPVNGTCGSAHGISTPIYPTANWCTTGTKADVDTTGSDGIYNWNCNGLYGGTGASCSANKIFYTVSGSFGTNGSGASITGCGGKTATASSTGMFLFTGVSNGTNCNNITATRTNYTCTTSTNGPASLTANVTNVAGSCTANTQTFTCAAKPATGTVWNSVSSYTQTWNGTAWSPANSTTAYNTTASTTSCRYTCASGYGWDGSSCATCNPGPSGTNLCPGAGFFASASHVAACDSACTNLGIPRCQSTIATYILYSWVPSGPSGICGCSCS